MSERMKVIAFSREAGGAEAIAPICKTLNRDDDLLLIASGYAVNLFNHQKLKPISFRATAQGCMSHVPLCQAASADFHAAR